MVILVEDKTNDIKQKFFLRRSPVRGRHPRLRFLPKPVENPNYLANLEFIDSLVSAPMTEVNTVRGSRIAKKDRERDAVSRHHGHRASDIF